ncbi:MAG: hypothetical protein E7665_04895 [Ruminococcaceae bacterium]|nr:hypothetical protein [Oscillospiraceae bacterium]
MKKIDPTVLKETFYVACFSVVFSLLMQAVYLAIGKWNTAVLFGNLLGYFAAVANFFLMGLTVQSAVMKEEKEARNLVKLSQNLRMVFLLVVAVIGYAVPIFDIIAVVIPFIFPRLSVTVRSLTIKDKD